MVLIDTSVWIDHFNRSDSRLLHLLNDYEVVTHPYILGELVCGNFRNRTEIFELLSNLPSVTTISMEEYFVFIEKNKLYGLGLGFVDIHLLASTLIAQCSLYTKDKALLSIADSFGIAYTSHR
jgi:predicted nucleic acid-binding protein